MKPLRSLLIGVLFGAALFAGWYFACAQTQESDTDAMVSAIEATTPLPPGELPEYGNFYTAEHYADWPPLPANILGLNGWNIGGGFILLDDRAVDYDALRLQSERTAQLSSMAMESGGFAPMSMEFGSNDLWLEITGVSNDVSLSYLVIHTPDTNGVYDLYLTTNLNTTDSSGLNGTNWLWVLRTDAGQTNLTVANPVSDQCFFLFGLTNDADEDGLPDTYENLVSHTDPNNGDQNSNGIPDGWEWAISAIWTRPPEETMTMMA